jgi:hypothetical protein
MRPPGSARSTGPQWNPGTAELRAQDPALFSQADRDGDGGLTFSEVMVNKTRGFEDADKNEDGLLSFEEMVEGPRASWGRHG